MLPRTALLAILMLCLPACDAAEPNSPIGAANGTFTNSCCGEIILLAGKMIVANQQIDYVVDEDKIGSFVLTPYYVGPSANGFVIRRDQFPLKMRLDSSVHPSEISLMSNRPGGGKYSFRRIYDR